MCLLSQIGTIAWLLVLGEWNAFSQELGGHVHWPARKWPGHFRAIGRIVVFDSEPTMLNFMTRAAAANITSVGNLIVDGGTSLTTFSKDLSINMPKSLRYPNPVRQNRSSLATNLFVAELKKEFRNSHLKSLFCHLILHNRHDYSGIGLLCPLHYRSCPWAGR